MRTQKKRKNVSFQNSLGSFCTNLIYREFQYIRVYIYMNHALFVVQYFSCLHFIINHYDTWTWMDIRFSHLKRNVSSRFTVLCELRSKVKLPPTCPAQPQKSPERNLTIIPAEEKKKHIQIKSCKMFKEVMIMIKYHQWQPNFYQTHMENSVQTNNLDLYWQLGNLDFVKNEGEKFLKTWVLVQHGLCFVK